MNARGAYTRPVFSHLSDAEARALLARNHVGRLAYVVNDHVDIEPVHYVASESWIYVRSARGTKLDAFEHRPYVAFEVDEVDGTFDWRSVVARGTIYVMSEPRSRVDVELRHAAVEVRGLTTRVATTQARLDALLAASDSVIRKVNHGDGTLGLMLNDPSIYRRTDSLLAELRLLAADVRANPKRFVSVKLF